MNRRVILDRDKLLVTKAGKDVFDPFLADEDKIFDSRWPFAFGVLGRGYYLGGEAPPNSQPYVTQHYFPSEIDKPLLITEVMPQQRSGGGFVKPSNGDDKITFSTSSGIRRSVDEVFNNVLSQSINMFSDRFEITWSGYNGNLRTLAFTWFVLALPAGQQ